MFRGIRSFNSRDVFQLESPVGLIDDLFALSPFHLSWTGGSSGIF